MQRILLAGALIFAPATLAAQGMASIDEALNSITEEDVRNRIAVIADDSMFGRNTPSPGLEATANYVAGQFYSFGLKPMGDGGSFMQRYPLNETGWDHGATHLTIAGTRLTAGEGFQILNPGNTGPVSGEAVVISGSLDDAEAFSALDLEGKIVFVMVPTVDGDFERVRDRRFSRVCLSFDVLAIGSLERPGIACLGVGRQFDEHIKQLLDPYGLLGVAVVTRASKTDGNQMTLA